MEAKNIQTEWKYKSERELVDGLLAGRKDAQEEFYKKYKNFFFYTLRNVLCDLSLKPDFEEDLVHDFIVYILENNAKRLIRFRGEKEGSFVYYLGKRARGYFIRYKTRYQNMIFVEYIENVSHGLNDTDEGEEGTMTISDNNCDDSMVDAIRREEAWNYIEHILASMRNQQYAEAIRMYYACDYNDEIVALKLNININNWYVRKKRAMKQLQDTHKKNKALWQNIISQMN